MVIFDLDGCLSDDRWRRPYIDWGHQDSELRYRDYHLLCGFDRFAGLTEEDHQRLARHDGYVVMTSRPEWTRPITLEWLARNRMPQPKKVYMRPERNYQPCEDLKGEMLLRAIREFNLPAYGWFGFDDLQCVVDRYRKLGAMAARRTL